MTCVTSSWKLDGFLRNEILLSHYFQILTRRMRLVLERGEAGVQCCRLRWCSMLLGSHLQVSFSHHNSVPWRLPRRRQQCGGTAPSRCFPAWASHHTFFFPPPLFSSTADQKGEPVNVETAAHTAIVSSTHFRTCHRTLSCKSHS